MGAAELMPLVVGRYRRYMCAGFATIRKGFGRAVTLGGGFLICPTPVAMETHKQTMLAAPCLEPRRIRAILIVSTPAPLRQVFAFVGGFLTTLAYAWPLAVIHPLLALFCTPGSCIAGLTFAILTDPLTSPWRIDHKQGISQAIVVAATRTTCCSMLLVQCRLLCTTLPANCPRHHSRY